MTPSRLLRPRALPFLLLLTLAAPASATSISTQVNPFGVPFVGTGIAIFAETTGAEAVTAQNWLFSGNIVNNDAPGTAAFLADPNKLQRQSETSLADLFDLANSPWSVHDSYWGNFFTSALLGAGFNGSGGANPGGAGITGMELQGGTTFGNNPTAQELLIYVVITAPIVFQGELAVGATELAIFEPSTLGLDGSITPIATSEPASLLLGGLALAAMALRRRAKA